MKKASSASDLLSFDHHRPPGHCRLLPMGPRPSPACLPPPTAPLLLTHRHTLTLTTAPRARRARRGLRRRDRPHHRRMCDRRRQVRSIPLPFSPLGPMRGVTPLGFAAWLNVPDVVRVLLGRRRRSAGHTLPDGRAPRTPSSEAAMAVRGLATQTEVTRVSREFGPYGAGCFVSVLLTSGTDR